MNFKDNGLLPKHHHTTMMMDDGLLPTQNETTNTFFYKYGNGLLLVGPRPIRQMWNGHGL